MKVLKITFLVFECLSRYNGAIVQLVELAAGLSKLGHDVEVYTPDIGRYPEKTIFTIKYVPVIDKPLLRNLSYIFNSFFYFLAKFLRKRPDVVIISEYYLDPVPSLICLLLGCPSFFYVNGIVAEDLKLPVFLRFIMPLVIYFQRLHCKIAARIFTITEAVRSDLCRRHNVLVEKITVLGDGVDPEKFKPYDTLESRKLIGLPCNGKYVGFVGGLFPYHGVDYLIHAAPLILEKVPDVKFVVVGDGIMRDSLVQLVQKMGLNNNFIFTGHKPYKLVPEYINSFDICVVFFKPPRNNAGDPIKMYEYMACAKPVIASNATGYGDFIENIGAGVSVNASEPEFLSNAIVTLIRNSSQLMEMGNHGRAAIIAGHTWMHRVRQMAQEFEIVLCGKS